MHASKTPLNYWALAVKPLSGTTDNEDLRSYESMTDLKAGIKRYFEFYNTERFHQSLDYLTPEVMYESFSTREDSRLAA